MVDKPILFSGPMVRALIRGDKHETRRIVKPQPVPFMRKVGDTEQECEVGVLHVEGDPRPRITLGRVITAQEIRWAVGDRLWVREAHWAWGFWETTGLTSKSGRPEHRFRAVGKRVVYENPGPAGPMAYFKTSMGAGAGNVGWAFRPSIHMPRWASRLTLTVEAVRVERLQEITREGAIAEGCTGGCGPGYDYALHAYMMLWNALHGAGAWAANPWVVVTQFSVRLGNIDAPPLANAPAPHKETEDA